MHGVCQRPNRGAIAISTIFEIDHVSETKSVCPLCMANIHYTYKIFVVVVDVTTLKMSKKPVNLQKENPAGCVGEGKIE